MTLYWDTFTAAQWAGFTADDWNTFKAYPPSTAVIYLEDVAGAVATPGRRGTLYIPDVVGRVGTENIYSPIPDADAGAVIELAPAPRYLDASYFAHWFDYSLAAGLHDAAGAVVTYDAQDTANSLYDAAGAVEMIDVGELHTGEDKWE